MIIPHHASTNWIIINEFDIHSSLPWIGAGFLFPFISITLHSHLQEGRWPHSNERLYIGEFCSLATGLKEFISLFLLSSSAPNILTGCLSERDLCWRWGCSPWWLSESSQGLGTSRETLEGGHGQMGTTGQHHKEGGKDGQVAHAGGGPLSRLCSHTEPKQPLASEGLHFCCSPKGRGISHPFLHPSSFVLHPGQS